MTSQTRASDLFTEITITATPEIVATVAETAIRANRLVWVSDLKPMRGTDTRVQLRLILRNP